MFRFLTRLRKDSVAGKRFGNYLLYAIGEIILVVIGILIALQINEWSNERKLKEKELAYMQDIAENLEYDRERLKEYIGFNEIKITQLDSSFVLVASDRVHPKDAARIMTNRMNNLTVYQYFLPKRTAFDNMVNAENIGIIRDKRLRTKLSEYYFDKLLALTTQERTKSMTRKFTDYFNPIILNNESAAEFYDAEMNIGEPGDLDFSGDRELLSILFSCRMATQGQKNELELVLKKNTDLRGMIAEFLLGNDD